MKVGIGDETQRPIKMEVWNRGWKCRVRILKKKTQGQTWWLGEPPFKGKKQTVGQTRDATKMKLLKGQ
jgi:hypothetical protein